MREVRMTFGEHLEDLRGRIIHSLIYLAVGLCITMTYGKELLEWTLGPHYQAISGARRDRLVARMEKNVRELRDLTSAAPLDPSEKPPKPLFEGPIYWETLFIRDVAVPQVAKSIEAPFHEASKKAKAALSPNPELADSMEAILEKLGTELARTLANEFTSALEIKGTGNIPTRFQEVLRLLERTQSAAGLNEIERAVGWGRDLAPVLDPLRQFILFLENRRRELEATPIGIDVLAARLKETELPRYLENLLETLERDAREIVEGKPKQPMVISYMESFAAYLKVAVIFAIILTLPFILYEIWKFVGAGLYPNEQKYVVSLLPFSLGLFVVGGLFGYFALIPIGLRFLAGWGLEDIDLNITLESYIGLFFTLTLILGLIFQTPLIMVFLTKIGIINVAGLRKARRMAIFVGVILAVVLTPPDPFSWSLMAAPMILLYEFGIVICGFLEGKKRRTAEVPVS